MNTVHNSEELMALVNKAHKDASFQIIPERNKGQESCTVRIITPEEAELFSHGDKTFFEDSSAVLMATQHLFPAEYNLALTVCEEGDL